MHSHARRGTAASLGFIFVLFALGSACSSSPDTADAGAPPTSDAAPADASPLVDATVDASPSDSSAEGGATCAGKGMPYPAGSTTEGSVMVSGKARTFRIHVPPSYRADRPTPIVLGFHGGGGSGKQFEESSLMNVQSDREGFVAVYPDGTGLVRTWNGGLCCGRAVEDDVDEKAFVSAILDHLEGALCADTRRIFATGMSNGGILSHRLACELSSRIAAVAPVAGTIGVSTCTPSRPVPVMHVHGSLDGHVPVGGGIGCGPSGASYVSIADTMEGWRARNGCATTTTSYTTMGDGSCVSYTGCTASTVLCTIEGGGHSWPGGAPRTGAIDCPGDGAQSTTFVANEVIWKFFQQNPMPAK
jgi:polyhydroxybutyrate depolymerase